MWGEKPSSVPRRLEKVNWESLAVHLPTFKAKVGRDQEKKIPHQGWKRRAETFGWQSCTLLHFLHWSFICFVPCNMKRKAELYWELHYCIFSIPFQVRTADTGTEQCSYAPWKALAYPDWSSWKKKATRCRAQSVGHPSAEPAGDGWCMRVQATTTSLWKAGEFRWGNLTWSLSLRKWAHSAEPRGMCLPLSTLPNPALSHKCFLELFVVPAISDIMCLSRACYIWLIFYTLLYNNNPVV